MFAKARTHTRTQTCNMFVCIHTHAHSALKHMAHGVHTQVFREVEALVTSVLDGYNVCIFAYGQTGSGTKPLTVEFSIDQPHFCVCISSNACVCAHVYTYTRTNTPTPPCT